MKKSLILITVFCLFYSLTHLSAQHPESFECYHEAEIETEGLLLCPNGQDCNSTFGRILTPKGTLRFLVVFAGFEGYEGNEEEIMNDNQPGLGGWDNEFSSEYQLPNFVNVQPDGSILTTEVFFNEESDFLPSGPIDDPENKSISKLLNMMSKPNEDFKFIGSVFTDENDAPILVTIDPTMITTTGWKSANRMVAEKMINEIRPITNPDGSPNLDNINYWEQFDKRDNSPQYCFDNSDTFTNPPDDILDFVIYIWRYSQGWNSNEQPISSMPDWNGSGGGFYANSVTTPSTLINDDLGFHHGFCIPKGAAVRNSGLLLHELGHGLYHGSHVGGANGVYGDHFNLPSASIGLVTPDIKTFQPFMSAWERWYIGFIDPVEVSSNQTVILRDYVNTGDAIRIEIPDSEGQHLWIENHTGQTEIDVHPFSDNTISGVDITDSDNGIYMYVEDIAEARNETGYTDVFDDGANGIYMINPIGNWDAQLDLALPPVLNSWGHSMLQYETLEENPIAGTNPWFRYLYDYKGGANGEANDILFYSTQPNTQLVDDSNEGEFIYREKINNTNEFTYRGFGVNGNQSSTAFLAGGKLSMGTNPTITNYPKFDLNNDKVNPYFLNGIQVEILSIDPTTGDAEINIQFKQTDIENNVRWTGDIILPNITEDNADDLTLAEDQEILLDKSKIANRTISPPEQNDFVNPTNFTISNGSKIHLEDRARIRVKNGSTLIIEEGAEVLLEDYACIVVEPEGTLHIKGNDINLNGPNAVIILKGTLKTDEDVDFNFTGPGYIDIHPTYQLDMGDNSNFVLERAITQNKERFMRVREDTNFELDN